MGGFSKPSQQNIRPAPNTAAPAPNKIRIPKGASADVREIDNGKIVRVTDKNYNTVSETFVPEGQDVNIE